MEPINRDQRIVLISMIALVAVAVFASDLYLPSMPAMARALHASHRAVKMTISIYLFGLGCSPLIFGPLSERHGRRYILLVGLVVALVGSLICALSYSIHLLILGRFIQAAGVASGLTLGRSMARDVFQGARLSQIGSYMGMMFGLIPAIAPTIGGYVQEAYGWRANFEILLLLIIAVFVWVLFVVPETNKNRSAHATRPKILLKTYWSLISQKGFIVYPIIACFSMSCFMIYLTISPFLFQNILGYTPVQFGWLAVVIGAGIISGSFCNSRLVKFVPGAKILMLAGIVMFVASIFMLLFGLYGVINFYVIMLPMFGIAVGSQLAFPNAFSGGMSKITVAVGFASALFTSIQMGSSSLANTIASMLHVRDQVPLAIMLSSVSLLLAVTVYCGVIRANK